jgi:hypothetical protein
MCAFSSNGTLVAMKFTVFGSEIFNAETFEFVAHLFEID